MSADASDRRVLYIVSPRYSGSTLLAFVIGSHPSIATLGERKKFYNKAISDDGTSLSCSCGEKFVHCPSWRELRAGLLERFSPEDLQPNFSTFRLSRHKLIDRLLYQSLLWSSPLTTTLSTHFRRIRTAAEANRYLIELACDQQGGEVFLDSSKPLRQALFLARTPGIALHVILLTRDPRAQVASALKYNDWDVQRAAREWLRETSSHFRFVPRLGVPYMHLRYEDFCRQPADAARDIFRFCGIDPDHSVQDFRSWNHHVMGNESMRLGSTTTIVERREWENLLSPAKIRTIEELTSSWRHLYSSTSGAPPADAPRTRRLRSH